MTEKGVYKDWTSRIRTIIRNLSLFAAKITLTYNLTILIVHNTVGDVLSKEGYMKTLRFWYCFVGVLISFLILTGNLLFAREKGPSNEAIKGAYQQILSGADKNGDGKLSMTECMSISSNKNKIKKDCRYWDADGDGFITQDEYMKQARRIMR